MSIFIHLLFSSVLAYATIPFSARGAHEVRAFKAAGAIELNGLFSKYQRRGAMEFAQQLRLDPDSGRVSVWAFVLPGNNGVDAVLSLADVQSGPTDSVWVTSKRGSVESDLSVRQIEGRAFRIQKRYATTDGVEAQLDPMDNRHLILNLGKIQGHFHAPADQLGEIIGFTVDRQALMVQTSALLNYVYKISNEGGVLVFEARRLQTLEIDRRDFQAEAVVYIPDCEKQLL